MEKNELRIIFMGTPEFAVGSLQRLVEGGYNVVAVVTQPDKPVGRHGSVLRAPAVKEYALAHNLPVLQPVKMKDPAFVEELRSYNADLQVVGNASLRNLQRACCPVATVSRRGTNQLGRNKRRNKNRRNNILP